ncbi:MAG: SH3 domain-containing protein [Aristaeellaceae bacterium]
MMHVWKKLLSVLLALAMLLPLMGASAEEELAAYGVCTGNQTNVRKQIGGAVWFQVDEGHVAQILGTKTDDNGDLWYKIESPHPVPNGRTYTGYIMGEFFRPMTEEELQAYLGTEAAPDSTDAPASAEGAITTGMVTADDVQLRAAPGLDASSYGKLPAGTVVELLSLPSIIDEDHWYQVRYNNRVGYIQSPFIRVLTVSEDDLPEVSKYGYARLISENKVNLRDTAGGETVTQWSGKGSLMRIVGEAQPSGQYSWYPVYHPERGTILYVREDMIEVVRVGGGSVVSRSADWAGLYGYVITTRGDVNLRINPAEDYIARVPRNTVMPCVGPAVEKDMDGVNYTWYKVVYNGMTGYLRGDCVRVCTADGGYLEDADLTPTPAPTGNPDAGESLYGYIRLNTGNRVNLREEPLGKSLGLLDDGTILPVVGEPTPYGLYGKYVWYPVRDAKNRFGWIRGDCVMECDRYGNALAPDEPTAPPEEELPDLVGVSGRILKNAHLRQGTSTDSESLTVMPANAIVAVLYIPEDTKDGWYKVSYHGETGYVHASLMEVILAGDEPEPTSLGYIMVTGSRVAVRKTPAGIELTRVDTGTVWPIIGASLTKDGVLWFNVRAGGYEGYIHSDYAFQLSPEQEESYLAGNGVPESTPDVPDDVFGNYLITVNTKGLNIRESASQDSTSYGRVPSGVVMQYFATKKVGTVTWYCVLYDHQERWVHGGYIEEMTEAEYRAWAAENPDQVPDKNSHLGYLKTNQANVYVRNAANGSQRLGLIADKGTVMRCYSDMIYAGGAGWYRVLTPDSGYAYIRDDLIQKCDENGGDLPAEKPDIGDTSNAPQSQQETSYTTLRLGDGGTDAKATKVRNLVQELKNQGYYKGKLTDVYTSDVKAAVEAFQSAKGLYVDGIAGSATQHALFGTVPIGAGNTDNLDFTIYPVEKIDWFTGGIQDMIPRGANFKVYDVKTGIVWWAHRWAGGNHADIETLTAADSARLCQIYGVKNLQEIVDKNLWQRRPCLVTIGTRTFACSLDGMQHNPAGDTIPNNGMNGQICLHFTNSMGHENPKVSSSHAEAIEYAYNNCPAGKK